jgi:hypothetical protein
LLSSFRSKGGETLSNLLKSQETTASGNSWIIEGRNFAAKHLLMDCSNKPT